MKKNSARKEHIKTFALEPGRILARKYEVLSLLGRGWEGEVYRIRERSTGIDRTAKIFFPHRNIRNRASDIYARKLHCLRECPAVIKYHAQELISFQRQPVTVLVSEYVEGLLLSEYLSRLPGKRATPFQAIHLLHALTVALESIHHMGEYHGDLHSDNVIVRRVGLSYELKLLDFFHWGGAGRENRRDDICFLVAIFHEALGGRKYYARLPAEVKEICCGLKRTLILKRFPTAADLRIHLETRAWS